MFHFPVAGPGYTQTPIMMSTNTTARVSCKGLRITGNPSARLIGEGSCRGNASSPRETTKPPLHTTAHADRSNGFSGLINDFVKMEMDIGCLTSCKEVKQYIHYVKRNTTEVEAILQEDPWHYGHKCNSSQCKTCDMWNPVNGYVIHQTLNKKILTNANENSNCATKNVVYCLECTVCHIQYVGETKQEIRSRMNGHRRNITGNGKDETIMANHFRKAHGHPVTPTVIILEQMADNSKDTDRKERESEWIRLLNTTHPWGLNENVRHFGSISETTDPMERNTNPWTLWKFPKVLRKCTQRNKRTKVKTKRNTADLQTIARNINQNSNSMNVQFATLMQLKPTELLSIMNTIHEQLLDFEYTTYQKVATVYLTKHKTKPIVSIQRQYLPFEYINSLSSAYPPERIRKMLRKALISETAKTKLSNIAFCRKLPPKLSSYAFNYASFLRNLNEESLVEIDSQQCDCHTNTCMDRHHGHVVTGKLGSLDDPYLEHLLSFGANHRQTTDPDLNSVCKTGIETLQTMIVIARKHMINAEAANLRDIYTEITDNIVKVTKNACGTGHNKLQVSNIQNRGTAEKHLKLAHKRYILVPIDKASNNVGIICKKYYCEIINKELGIQIRNNANCLIQGNETYQQTVVTLEDIISLHNEYTQRFCCTDLSQENRKIALLWPTLKCHKTPVKFRFIAGARNCTTKQLSVFLSRILTTWKTHFEHYTTVISKQRGYSFSWMIKNSSNVIARSQRTRSNGKLTIADFSTLYTSFEHTTILQCMNTLTDMLFKNANKKYLAVGKVAYFHSHESGNRQKLQKQDIMELVHCVVTNSFVKHADIIFHQTKGLPMGGNASPLLADLCLAMMEMKYIMANPTDGRRLTNTMRYIDDILTLNSTLMKEVHGEIYDKSLPLTFDDTTNGQGHYLDLQINRNTGHIDLYDKRNDFNFTVIRFTHASSNCPRNTGLNTFYSQVIRISRICNEVSDFERHLRDLLVLLLEKGYTTIELRRTLYKVSAAYNAVLRKFNLNTKKLINAWLSRNHFD